MVVDDCQRPIGEVGHRGGGSGRRQVAKGPWLVPGVAFVSGQARVDVAQVGADVHEQALAEGDEAGLLAADVASRKLHATTSRPPGEAPIIGQIAEGNLPV